MLVEDVLGEIKEIFRLSDDGEYRVSSLSQADLERWSASLQISTLALYDKIGRWLASEYYRGRLTFTFCDAVLNDTFSLYCEKEKMPPPDGLYWDTFGAFDAGEYHHQEDRHDPSIDSEIKYTKPAIARIIAEHGLYETAGDEPA